MKVKLIHILNTGTIVVVMCSVNVCLLVFRADDVSLDVGVLNYDGERTGFIGQPISKQGTFISPKYHICVFNNL